MGSTLFQKHIDEFMLVKQAEGVSESCLRKYKYGLNYFKSWLGDEEVTKFKYSQFLGYMKENKVTDWYQKTNAQILKTCMRYLISEGYDFPFPNYKMPRIHRRKLLYLDTSDMKRLIKSELSEQELLIIRMFISTGLRLNELVMLDWKDVNFKSGSIAVNFGKGDKFRTVITDKKTLVLLLKYKNRNDIENLQSPVFSHDEGLRYKPFGMRTIINRIRSKTGINFTAHALRRTFARQAVLNGMGIEFVQQLMGHESIEMTRHYVGLLDVADLVSNYNQHTPINLT